MTETTRLGKNYTDETKPEIVVFQTTLTCEFCDNEPTCFDDDGFYICDECRWENEKDVMMEFLMVHKVTP